MTSLTLGIETSGLTAQVALRSAGQLLEERELEHARRRHAQTLIQELQILLRNHNVAPQQITLVGVSQGPGSFTGLRVGIVAASTFAYATGCRLAAVDTFAAIAEAADSSVMSLCVVSDAQRDQLFAGEFVRDSVTGLFTPTADVTILDTDNWRSSLCERASESFAIAGPVLKRLRETLPPGIRQLDESAWQPRAAAVAAIAQRLAAAGRFADPFTLEPFYLRKSAAEEKRDARRNTA